MSRPQSSQARVPEEWTEIFQRCEEEPSDSPAWDVVEPFIAAVKVLASEKREMRRRQALIDDFIVFRDKHAAFLALHGFDLASSADAVGDGAFLRDGMETLGKAIEECSSMTVAQHGFMAIASAHEQLKNAVEVLNAMCGIEPAPKHVDVPSVPMPVEKNAETVPRVAEPVESAQVDRPSVEQKIDAITPLVASALPPALETPPSPETELPVSLRTFDTFCRFHWVDWDGSCLPAPWTTDDFLDKLAPAATTALKDRQLQRAWIFCAAARGLDVPPAFQPEDLEALAEMLPNADAGWAALPSRTERLRTEAGKSGPLEDVALTLVLEALAPNWEAPLAHAEVDRLAERLGGDAAVIVEHLLKQAAVGIGPLESLRRWAAGQHEQDEGRDAGQRLAKERAGLQTRVRELWSAAGGKLKLTHVREAWNLFMQRKVDPLSRQMFPTQNPNDHRQWKVDDLFREVARLEGDAASIADKGDVRYAERSKFDEAVREICQLMKRIVEMAGQARDRRGSQGGQGHPVPNEEVERFLTTVHIDPVEDVFCSMLKRALEAETPRPSAGASPHPLELLGTDVAARPDLLTLLGGQNFGRSGRFEPAAKVTTIREPQHAAAMLLGTPLVNVQIGGKWEELRETVREQLSLSGRRELLLYLGGSQLVTPEETARIQGERSERLDRLRTRLPELARARQQADELNLRVREDLNVAVNEARLLLNTASDVRAERHGALLVHWIDALQNAAQMAVNAGAANLRHAAHERDDRDAILAAVTQQRFSDAHRLLSLPLAAEPQEWQKLRALAWRTDAQSCYPNPAETLRKGFADGGREAELCRLWLRPNLVGSESDPRSLRQKFYEFISGDDAEKTNYREYKPKAVSIPALAWVERLHAEGHNPTFLPALRDINHLQLVHHAAPSSQEAMNADINIVLNTHQQDLASGDVLVLLSPGLEEARRAEMLRSFRTRGKAVAVVDDLDLCRLLAPGGRRAESLFIGLLEIILEQADWAARSPFRSVDGQFIQLEMFVGRKQDADKLASQPAISRVFAGRRLGKSALLKSLELSRHGATLPSGQRLRVLYLVAGTDQDAWIVSAIIAKLETLDDFRVSERAKAIADPGERLSEALGEFIESRAKDNLLIILDEADWFVEEQIRQYDRMREKCLSFRMVKVIPGQKVDATGIPRVRFLLSGYRCTNTREGTWANAGEVLTLGPLASEEAEILVAGPLARLGIDARDQSGTIAFRCGHQPAVILKFGERLVNHLSQRRGVLTGSAIVSAEDVIAVLDDPVVKEEIRTVITNNFQGDPIGGVLFTALLLVFRDMAPGAGLPVKDAADRVLEVICQADPDTGWLKRLDPTMLGEIRRHLRDFIARTLLVEDKTPAPGGYRLRFPHFLTTLLEGTELDANLQARIRALREGGGRDFGTSSLLPPEDMSQLRTVLQPAESDREFTSFIRAAVTASPWQESLQGDPNGLADRLGLAQNAGDVCDWSNAQFEPQDLDGKCRMAINVSSSAAEHWLRHAPRPSQPPILVGGTDLLRWGLERDLAAAEELWLCLGIRRLSQPYLTWWFQRARSWHFDQADAVERIWHATSGIPLLVGEVDRLIAEPFGAGVSGPALDRALIAAAERLPTLAADLVSGPPARVLTPREREILQMVDHVGAFQLQFDFDQLLAGDWEALREGPLAAVPAFGSDPHDLLSRRVLEMAGWLPSSADGLISLEPDDALFRVVRAFTT